MEENSTESKDNLYKEIGEKMYPLFFKRNFGLATKSEIESMLFYSYLKYKEHGDDDYSDRTLSRELGISEIKVRNLKRTCYARYEDAIDFPQLLISLAKKDSNLMFFKIYNGNNDVLCRISVSEVVYYDELRTQLSNRGIHFKKDPGSNYVELLMADAIIFFNQDSISIGSSELTSLIDEMKSLDFKTSTKNDLNKILEGTKAGRLKDIFEAVVNLYKPI
ncbi:PcfX family protein [Enterococcus faecalis]|uniref:PcfX family protein n=1 Tax=Enterococcus faecalis TaxID=1351 RepID=UPI002DBAAB25|nr:PcfX family protein [Enterococcus faecalis]MEB7921975.1 PcfX family protein [Enterococcus faecalis]